MKTPKIELVYFDGCPNVSQTRDHLRDAIKASGQQLTWSEWNLLEESTPAEFQRLGSPTVLVDGKDVTGESGGASAMSCRADGAPSVASIAQRLPPPATP